VVSDPVSCALPLNANLDAGCAVGRVLHASLMNVPSTVRSFQGARQRGYHEVKRIQADIQNQEKSIHEYQQAIFDALLKSSRDGRAKVLEWVSQFLHLNKSRERERFDQATTASDGTMLNLCAVLLKLCMPLSKVKKTKTGSFKSLADDVDRSFLQGASPAFHRGLELLARSVSGDAESEDDATARADGGEDDESDDDDDLYEPVPSTTSEADEEQQLLAEAIAASLKSLKPEDHDRSSDHEFSAVTRYFFYAARAQNLSVGSMLRQHRMLRRHIGQLYHQTQQVRLLLS